MSVYEILNFIPDETVESLPFDLWYRHYEHEILALYAIFAESLLDLEPFCNKNIFEKKFLDTFAKFIFEKSSKVLK